MSILKNVVLPLFVTALVAGVAQGAEKQAADKPAAEKHQSKAEQTADAPAQCPVMGKPIDETVYSYYKNRRVYFCCEHCKATFAEEPLKYAEGVEKQWAAMPIIRQQVNCPVTGKPIKREFHVEEPDMRVYFANEEAKKTWESWPAAKRKMRKPEMFTFQTKCVISGNDINPEVFEDLNGQRVYFFCENCQAEGKAHPKETAEKAKAQIKKNSDAFTTQQLKLLKAIMDKQQESKKAG